MRYPSLSTLWLTVVLLAPLTAMAAEPFQPKTGDTVLLQRTPGAALATRAARAALTPADASGRAMAAQAAIDTARRTGDLRYLGQAQALLGNDWSAEAPPLASRLVRATLRQQRHDFEGALADLAAVLSADPHNAQARLTRASIRLAQGVPQQARADCAALIGHAGLLVATTCLGSVNALQGQARPALQAMELALARDAAAPVAIRLWTLTQMAEIAERLGDLPRATEFFASALALAEAEGENDIYLQAAHADFLLAQGRAPEVLTLLAAKTDFDPLLLRLAMAQAQAAQAQGRPTTAAAAVNLQALLERFALAKTRGDGTHLREQGLTALHLQAEPLAALQLAQENWATQREPADAILLLQAALASGRKAAATPVLTWMRELRIEDVRLQALAAQLAVQP